jgi:ATP phosphoribosyltransferase
VTDVLNLAVPSKGAMEEPTLRFLAECGLAVHRTNPRQYSARMSGHGGMSAVFQRAADIPQKLALGLVDAGITGYDIFREHVGESDEVAVAIDDLGFARCALVLAVPEAWLDVSTIEDLCDVASEFRQRGRRLRVATKFPRLVRRFLMNNGLSSHALVEGTGALEIAPQMGYADIIADINETGTTLRANHLKTISGGTILSSHACLLVNRHRLLESAARLEMVRELLEMIEAHQRARGVVSVTANVEADSADAAGFKVLSRRSLAGVRGPTVMPVFDPNAPGRVFAVTIVIPSELLGEARDHLRTCGGGTITVQRPLYLFGERSAAFESLKELLGLSGLGVQADQMESAVTPGQP